MSKKLDEETNRTYPINMSKDEYIEWCCEFEYLRGVVGSYLKRNKKSIKLVAKKESINGNMGN